jgi:hypothetical protein
MKTIEIAEASGPLADSTKGVGSEPLVVTENGTPTAVILPLANTDIETVALSTNPEFLALVERARVRAREEGELSADEIRRRVLSGP